MGEGANIVNAYVCKTYMQTIAIVSINQQINVEQTIYAKIEETVMWART